MAGRRTLVAWIITLAALLATAALAPRTCAANEASLDTSPEAIEARLVTSGDPIYVTVRLKAGDEALSNIMLSALSNDGIAATIEGEPSAAAVLELAAKAEHVWKLKLVPSTGDALPPTTLSVYIHVAF